jgi:branched-chain amino acid transport system permease protein
LNIVIGYAGLLDLGYAAFFAIGAYTMGLFNSPLMGFEWGFWKVIWLSAVVSAAFGVMIGAPTLRVRGDYLAIITLAFGEIIPVAIRNLGDITIQIGGWQPVYRLNLTGGENGVNPIGQPYLPGVRDQRHTLVLSHLDHRRRVGLGHEPFARFTFRSCLDGDPRG